jgi:hypothetical protein
MARPTHVYADGSVTSFVSSPSAAHDNVPTILRTSRSVRLVVNPERRDEIFLRNPVTGAVFTQTYKANEVEGSVLSLNMGVFASVEDL